MIPDFISAIYLWVADKIGGPYPVWRPWLVPVCLFILFVGVSVLFITAKDEPSPPPVLVIGYEAEIEALKLRASIVEANQTALINAINKVIEAVNRIKSPYLGNLATKSELDQMRLGIKAVEFEVKALEKELTRITNIYGHYQLSSDSQFEEIRQSVKDMDEALTAHTDNTTIHKE